MIGNSFICGIESVNHERPPGAGLDKERMHENRE